MTYKSIFETKGKEYLEQIISESSSISDVFDKYNRAICGGSFREFKKLIKKWNISLPIPKKVIKKSFEYPNRRPLEEILCENSNARRNVLRRAIIRNKLIDNTKCSICNGNDIWNNKPITLVLDHINGVRDDNRIENLRFVCPNCNSQLNTTGNKNPNRPNKAIKNYCIDCGKNISRNGIRCIQCQGISSRKIVRPSIESLKIDVEKLGYSGTGRKYGVSDNTIKDWLE
jgi:hypothetical protein